LYSTQAPQVVYKSFHSDRSSIINDFTFRFTSLLDDHLSFLDSISKKWVRFWTNIASP
jgi:hypothetical protein